MPIFNAERFLEQSLTSLHAQTYDDFELVICDNASTDRTQEICRDYAANDNRIRYFRNETNIGGPGNFNRAFHLCRGEYHKWSTADDYCDTKVLEKCVDVLDRHPEVVLCYPKTTLIDEGNALIAQYHDNLNLQDPSPSERFMRLLATIGLCHAHLGLIRRQVLSRTTLLGHHLGSDADLLAELALYGRFFLMSEFLFFRRFHPASSSWDREDMQRQRDYYDPGHKTYFGMHTIKKYIKLFTVVQRAPIGVSEKLRLFRFLGRRMRWDRAVLARELLETLRPARVVSCGIHSKHTNHTS